jgi:hypothetical protein
VVLFICTYFVANHNRDMEGKGGAVQCTVSTVHCTACLMKEENEH